VRVDEIKLSVFAACPAGWLDGPFDARRGNFGLCELAFPAAGRGKHLDCEPFSIWTPVPAPPIILVVGSMNVYALPMATSVS
jgi:hypothetical protein